jgi:hypothetical protein
MCGQNVEFLNAIHGGSWGSHGASGGLNFSRTYL